ncbi:MAG: hypothetical protein K9G57_02940 [Ignavibacteriales bacterium]|nr:hypothetical protein [Ignavibacteriales bacterium]MCF8435774.1 hypothetical protein [Ignavibacteriales bacterium]
MPSFYHTWLPFIYLYGVGGVFFVLGLIFAIKSNALNLKKKKHKYWLRVLIFGYLYFMFIHAFFTIAALYW